MMHAIYSAADEYKLVGFVDADYRDRVPQLTDPVAGCYVSLEPMGDDEYRSALKHLRFMEGAAWQR